MTSTVVAGAGTPKIDRPVPSWLLYAYFLRTQIATVIVLVALPIVALNSRAAPLLNGLFDISYGTRWEEARAMFLIAFVGVAVGGAVATTMWTTLVNGHDRFEVDQWQSLPTIVPRWACACAALPAACSVYAAIRHSWSASAVGPLHLTAGAIAGASLSFWMLEYARVRFATRRRPGGFLEQRSFSGCSSSGRPAASRSTTPCFSSAAASRRCRGT